MSHGTDQWGDSFQLTFVFIGSKHHLSPIIPKHLADTDAAVESMASILMESARISKNPISDSLNMRHSLTDLHA